MLLKAQQYRLVTRSDFDGLVCAVLLKSLNLINEIKFVHPKDMQDGKIEITNHDITTNLPYVEGTYLAFDHHFSETLRNRDRSSTHIIDPNAPSAARVVYDYFGGAEKFPHISQEMMTAVDRADSAQFTLEEVLRPQGWVLLNFLMDARTGLGRFRDFRISNYDLMMNSIDACKDSTIDEILNLPDVKERVDVYREHEAKFQAQIKKCATVRDKTVVLDLRQEETIYAGNRFMVYALYPECTVSIHVMWGLKQQNTVFAVGKSIFDRSSQVNIGELMLKYGGGGHANAGTCQVAHEVVDETLREILSQIKANE
ncbi:exopolyphosphatase [Chroococcidiopsis sp. CCALA 051]|uniref:exopolyphosphatase n=1 Tax=Chroococcidiopsis sp. CCALA 051 TaxID=869949 RepID=UPI000D0DD179|nr:exopolyphosphatase [Chroococcidiopsis sp. CCALA 051]MBE9019529.1 exopolyphosphatase [Chroococcidiopsidales cyanobacterium LEGE 13417]PSM48730.1 exopolyphosphatase [Chroococcidiopsis sp. CCALA 051]